MIEITKKMKNLKLSKFDDSCDKIRIVISYDENAKFLIFDEVCEKFAKSSKSVNQLPPFYS